jgi:hypothetical protein
MFFLFTISNASEDSRNRLIALTKLANGLNIREKNTDLVTYTFILDRLFSSNYLQDKNRFSKVNRLMLRAKNRSQFRTNLNNAWRYAVERKYRVDNVDDLWEGPTPYEDFEKHLLPRSFLFRQEEGRLYIPDHLPSVARDEVYKDFVYPQQSSASVPREIDVTTIKASIFCHFPSRVISFVE